MKTAVKILNLITKIINIIGIGAFVALIIFFALTPLENTASNMTERTALITAKVSVIICFAIGLVFLIISLIVNQKCTKKYLEYNGSNKQELVAPSILILILVNTISGILMLVDIFNNKAEVNTIKNDSINENSVSNIAKKLETLKSLKDQGLISEEEYQAKRKEYVDLL